MVESFVLAVDKPAGPTSHDVVAWARRAFGTRAIGHAGTLDPAATGVLVLAVEQATKLVPYLTLDDKVYETVVTLGSETTTLDAAGDVVRTMAVPTLERSTVEAAARAFVGTHPQRAPVVSAIKRDGVALHERVRRGEDVEAPVRDVTLYEVTLLDLRDDALRLRLHVGKGFYVRSFARDLAIALGTVGHVSELRRTRSGTFSLDGAIPATWLEAIPRGASPEQAAARAELLARSAPFRRAMVDAVALPRLTLTDAEARDVRHGKRIGHAELASRTDGEPIVLVDEAGALVAIAERVDTTLRVLRGFT